MSRLKEIAQQIGKDKMPPVHLWKPDHVGDIDIRIDAQGFWFHEGDPIAREELVKLFASILWCENGQHYLVTPVEKLAIEVADSPYLIHQMEHVDEQGQEAWVAVTNTHESLIISSENPVELRFYQEQWVPYVNIRYDLWARVNRSIYYQWVSEAMDAAPGSSSDNESINPNDLVLTSLGYEFEVARL